MVLTWTGTEGKSENEPCREMDASRIKEIDMGHPRIRKGPVQPGVGGCCDPHKINRARKRENGDHCVTDSKSQDVVLSPFCAFSRRNTPYSSNEHDTYGSW